MKTVYIVNINLSAGGKLRRRNSFSIAKVHANVVFPFIENFRFFFMREIYGVFFFSLFVPTIIRFLLNKGKIQCDHRTFPHRRAIKL